MTEEDVQTLADALGVQDYIVHAAFTAPHDRRTYLRLNEPELYHRGVRRARQVTIAVALTLELGRAGAVWEVAADGTSSGLADWVRSHPALRVATNPGANGSSRGPVRARFRSMRGLAVELAERGFSVLLIDGPPLVRAVAVVDDQRVADVVAALARREVQAEVVHPRAATDGVPSGVRTREARTADRHARGWSVLRRPARRGMHG